jgi:hypothetical protein
MIKQYYNFTTEKEIISALQIFKQLEGFYDQNKRNRSTTLYQDRDNPAFLDLVSCYTAKLKEILQKEIYVHSSAIVKYNPGDSMELHSDIQIGCDDDIIGMIVYFDDKYTGGSIVFPHQNPSLEINPIKAMAITYPIHGDEFMHYIKEITSGVRYAMTFCFTTNKKYIKDCYRTLYE